MSLPPPLEQLRRAPGMSLRSPSFDSLVAFIDGYDIALSGAVLLGFREWLIVRAGDGNNLSWDGLVLLNLGEPRSEDSERRMDGLFSLLGEFLTQKQSRGGLRLIYASYEQWLRGQRWYAPGSPDWIPPAR